MLSVPDNYKTWNMIFLDPGLNNTGVSIYTIESSTNNVISIDAFTIENEKSRLETGIDEESYSERYVKLHRLAISIQRILLVYRPSIVVCESPFFNRFRPTAYAALVQVLQVLQDAVFNFNPNIYFSTLEPLLIKKYIGAGMLKGKIDVKAAVSSNDFIKQRLTKDLNHLDEHAIDAIAIGYTYLRIQGVFHV